MAEHTKTVWPRGMGSPKLKMSATVSFDPFQQRAFAKARAQGTDEAWQDVVSETQRLVLDYGV